MSLLEELSTVGLELNVPQSHAAMDSLRKIQRALASLSDLANRGKTVDAAVLQSILNDADAGAEALSDLFTALGPIYVRSFSWLVSVTY
jgi:hypothetical protein